MKDYVFVVRHDWDEKSFPIVIKASNDYEAKKKFLKSNKYVVGIFGNSKGKNEIIENPVVDNLERTIDKAFEYDHKSNVLRKRIKQLKEEVRSNDMKHRYGIYVASEIRKKGWYLSKKEKQSLWSRVKKEFHDHDLKRRK